jgi:hypothetical protein
MASQTLVMFLLREHLLLLVDSWLRVVGLTAAPLWHERLCRGVLNCVCPLLIVDSCLWQVFHVGLAEHFATLLVPHCCLLPGCTYVHAMQS